MVRLAVCAWDPGDVKEDNTYRRVESGSYKKHLHRKTIIDCLISVR